MNGNLKIAAQMQRAADEMDSLIREYMRDIEDRALYDVAQLLIADETMRFAIDGLVRKAPSDMAAMIAYHYYRELFRRIETRAMEAQL